ncbi:hypothetical protein JXA27_06615 [Aerococcaceae bacterium zg-B36]|uniref:hypothetical protein n=1 Tax=Aerococcaceae bacterium zg-252 TaxID=2796928 RepID=UPI001BD833A1|nr:hypothetical protein [Aerococcaceae bacterium zg-B36]
MQLILQSITILILAIALYFTEIRVDRLEKKLEFFRELMVSESDRVEKLIQMIDQLYKKQLKSDANLFEDIA